ncbi:MAG: ATP-binding protein [Gordonia sp. (in: high G+C Gram-positive bacteria)]
MADDPLVDAIARAVEQSPADVALRAHFAELLMQRGRFAEAVTQCGIGLAAAPGDELLLSCLGQAAAGLGAAPATPPVAPGVSPAPAAPAGPAPQVPSRPDPSVGQFDWAAAEDQIDPELVEAFAEGDPLPPLDEYDVEVLVEPGARMSDVGGMDDVKRQLDLTLFGPLRNPELARAYATSARGGLLLYGPPGCGKSFLAGAIAGELGARFYRVEVSDVLSRWLGESEQAITAIFDTARRNAPCVLFFDELDALGHKRSQIGSGMRTVVNQLLLEMDSGKADNSGVYILGATNHPWDVDNALRRPGRFDRMILVAPPDAEARAAIIGFHLRDRPVVGVDAQELARRTEGLSGADLAHLCNTATQYAMQASVQTGRVQPVTGREVDAALRQVRSSTGGWFETAESVLQFANGDGSFDDLAAYMRRRPRRRR